MDHLQTIEWRWSVGEGVAHGLSVDVTDHCMLEIHR